MFHSFQVSSLLSEAYSKAANGFGQLDYGLLTEVYFLKMTLFPVEISTHLMTFLMETHVALTCNSASSYKTLQNITDVTTDGSPSAKK
jgi:hypothetical protein